MEEENINKYNSSISLKYQGVFMSTSTNNWCWLLLGLMLIHVFVLGHHYSAAMKCSNYKGLFTLFHNTLTVDFSLYLNSCFYSLSLGWWQGLNGHEGYVCAAGGWCDMEVFLQTSRGFVKKNQGSGGLAAAHHQPAECCCMSEFSFLTLHVGLKATVTVMWNPFRDSSPWVWTGRRSWQRDCWWNWWSSFLQRNQKQEN